MKDGQDNIKSRLKREAEFQNRRVEGKRAGEPRDKFYYLDASARKHYHRTLENVKGKVVLVVGCSEGGVTPLARKGANVIGIDIAEKAIVSLKKNIENEGLSGRARAELMNGEDLTIENRSLDIICCAGVLHHLDVEKAAASWAKALSPRGRVTMLEPMAWNPVVALYRALTPSMRTPDEHPLKPSDIAILKRYFGTVKVQGYVLTSLFSLTWVYLPDVWSLKNRSMYFLEKLDSFLLRVFPILSYFCWTAVIEAFEPKND